MRSAICAPVNSQSGTVDVVELVDVVDVVDGPRVVVVVGAHFVAAHCGPQNPTPHDPAPGSGRGVVGAGQSTV